MAQTPDTSAADARHAALREQLALTALHAQGAGASPAQCVDAAVACMGAAAIILALVPPDARRVGLAMILEALPKHAERRATEIALIQRGERLQ